MTPNPCAAPVPDDVLAWLLEPDTPAVRHAALRDLLDRPCDDVERREALAAAMAADPIAAILQEQDPQGWWVKPGAGYAPKYVSTVWQVVFLDQLGADGREPRVRAACEYVLEHCLTVSAGFGASGSVRPAPPPPSSCLHCLNGNLVRALIGFGWLDDPRLQQAIRWEADAILGSARYYASGTSGPGFACGANDLQPCAWGAVKAISGLARIPPGRRSDAVQRALAVGAEFLLSKDPAIADYPMGYGYTTPNRSWFKLGFPSGYIADVLEVLQVLLDLGLGADARLDAAVAWVLGQADADGLWRNRHSYSRKMWIDIEPQGKPSKWVTLRAHRMVRGVQAARAADRRPA